MDGRVAVCTTKQVSIADGREQYTKQDQGKKQKLPCHMRDGHVLTDVAPNGEHGNNMADFRINQSSLRKKRSSLEKADFY
jgi:hypothetical protein